MGKKLTAVLLAVAVLLQPVLAVAAGEFDDYAEKLKDLGLFSGTNKGFELDRSPSRAEALVMLIRLLGKESEALSNPPPPDSGHPFTDVPAWADPYVSYAYRNGLTAGVAENLFGSDETVTAQQYFTFVLRALGYSDSAGDFQWDQSIAKAAEIGIVTRDDYRQAGTPFLRGNLVDISYNALDAKLKGEDITLREKLIAEGLKGQDAKEPEKPISGSTIGVRMEGIRLIVPLSPSSQWKDSLEASMSAIAAVLSDVCLLAGCFDGQGLSVQQQYVKVLDAYLTSTFPQADRVILGSLTSGTGATAWFLLDRNRYLLAYALPDSLQVSGETAEIVFETEIGFDSRAIVDGIVEPARALSAGACEFPNSVFHQSSYTYKKLGPDQNTLIDVVVPKMTLSRDELPETVLGSTRYSYIGYYWRDAAWIARGLKQVYSLDDIDVPDTLMRERIGYLTSDNKGGYAQPIDWDYAFSELCRRDWTSQFSLLIVLLQDDSGVIKGYTAFTAADLARIAVP